MVRGSNVHRGTGFFFLFSSKRSNRLWGSFGLLCNARWGGALPPRCLGWGVRLNTYLHTVPSLRMSAAVGYSCPAMRLVCPGITLSFLFVLCNSVITGTSLALSLNNYRTTFPKSVEQSLRSLEAPGLTLERGSLYTSPRIIRVVKSRRIGSAWHVARMGERRGAYRVLMRWYEGKRPLGRPRRRWEGNDKMDLQWL